MSRIRLFPQQIVVKISETPEAPSRLIPIPEQTGISASTGTSHAWVAYSEQQVLRPPPEERQNNGESERRTN
jgi:hypothetical protein